MSKVFIGIIVRTPRWLEDNFLFLGYYSSITANRMPNILGDDYLEVTGTEGSESYRCPDTIEYRNADEDKVWFTLAGVRRSATTQELVCYDLQRTPVKYDDNPPNQIRMIGILKPGITLSSENRDNLFLYFELPIFWDDNYNDYGHEKDKEMISTGLGIGWGQNIYPGGIVFEAETTALIARMDATGENRPANYDGHLNTLIKGLKSDGLWDTQWDVLVNLRGGTGIGAQTARLNMIKDAHNATEVNTPSYTAGLGYKTGGTGYINTNYKVRTDKVKLSRLNASFVLKLSGTLASGLHGAGNTSSIQLGIGGFGNVMLANGGGNHPRVVGYNCLARINDTTNDCYQNANAFNDASNAAIEAALPQLDCWILNYSLGSYLCGSAEVAEMYALGKYITQADFIKFQDHFNTFYSNVI